MPSPRQAPKARGFRATWKQGTGRRRQRKGRGGAIRKFHRSRDQCRAIRGDPAIGTLAKPEGDSAVYAVRNHQPEPEDSHRGASRRRIIGDTEGTVEGTTLTRAVGSAERMQGQGNRPTASPAKPDLYGRRGDPHDRAGGPQAAGKQRGNSQQVSNLRRWGDRTSGKPGARPTGTAHGPASTGQLVQPSPARSSAAARGETRSRSANQAGRCSSSGAPREDRIGRAERIDE